MLATTIVTDKERELYSKRYLDFHEKSLLIFKGEWRGGRAFRRSAKKQKSIPVFKNVAHTGIIVYGHSAVGFGSMFPNTHFPYIDISRISLT